MKNALIKSSIVFLLIICLGCKKDTSPLLPSKDPNSISISKESVCFSYPYKELYDILRISNNDTDRVLLYKITTKKKIEYEIEFCKNGTSSSFKFPFYREFIDYEPYLSLKLDDEIEKLYYKTPKKCFIVKLNYGTGHIQWNYLYEIDKEIKLKDIFYTEPHKNYVGKQDTLMYLVKFKIDTNLKGIPFEAIKKINYDIENDSLKEEKWLIN